MGSLNESNQANLKSISLAGLLAGKADAVNDLVLISVINQLAAF
jgi:hypothetical protein